MSGVFWFSRVRSPPPPSPFTSPTSSLASYQTFMSWLHMSTQGGLRFWRGVNVNKHQQKRKQSLKTSLAFSSQKDGLEPTIFHSNCSCRILNSNHLLLWTQKKVSSKTGRINLKKKKSWHLQQRLRNHLCYCGEIWCLLQDVLINGRLDP